MALSKPAPSPELMSALRTGLPDFLEPGDQLAASLFQRYETHQVFTLGLQQFPIAKAADLLTEAKPVGWRFMAAGATSGLACHVAGTDPKSAGKNPKVMGMAHSKEIGVMLDLLHRLDEHVQRPAQDWPPLEEEYEVRALRIPGLLLEALWLHCLKDPEKDYVVPFAGFIESAVDPTAEVKPELMKLYLAKDFFPMLNAAAERKLAKHRGLYPKDYPK